MAIAHWLSCLRSSFCFVFLICAMPYVIWRMSDWPVYPKITLSNAIAFNFESLPYKRREA